jgi:hypothetical protein
MGGGLIGQRSPAGEQVSDLNPWRIPHSQHPKKKEIRQKTETNEN